MAVGAFKEGSQKPRQTQMRSCDSQRGAATDSAISLDARDLEHHRGKCLYWSMKKYSVGMLRCQSIPEIAEIQCSSKHSRGHTGGRTASSLMLPGAMHSHAVESAAQDPHSRGKRKTAAAAHGLLDAPGIRCHGSWYKAKQLIRLLD